MGLRLTPLRHLLVSLTSCILTSAVTEIQKEQSSGQNPVLPAQQGLTAFRHAQNTQHQTHNPLYRHGLLANKATLLLRDIFVVQNKCTLDIAFLRVNGRHAEDFHSGAVVASWRDILVHFHGASHLDQPSDALLRREADVGVVRHNNAHQSCREADELCGGRKVKCIKTSVNQVTHPVSLGLSFLDRNHPPSAEKLKYMGQDRS